MNTRLKGGCLCGAVEYEVADEFRYAMVCHCSQCRRATGSAFKPFGGIERAKFAVVRGKDHLRIFGDVMAHNAHCRACGSLLYSVVREGAWTHVTYGTLIDAPTLGPQAHIFVGSKAPWYAIRDSLPQHAGFPPDEPLDSPACPAVT
jgi:hypothetical protein